MHVRHAFGMRMHIIIFWWAHVNPNRSPVPIPNPNGTPNPTDPTLNATLTR